jgi:hypothetical protein
VNRPAEAALGGAELLPEGRVAKRSALPPADPEPGTTPVAIAPAVETTDAVVLDGTVVTEDAVVCGFDSAVVTCGRVVVTFGTVVVTFGTAVVTGRLVVSLGMVVVTCGRVVVTFGTVVVTFGTVVVTGSVVVTLGSVVDTGNVVEIGGSVVVIVICGTAERPGMAVLARKPRRRTTASAAARFTSYDIPRAAASQSLRTSGVGTAELGAGTRGLRPGPREPGPSSTLTRLSTRLQASFDARCVFSSARFLMHVAPFLDLSSPAARAEPLRFERQERRTLGGSGSRLPARERSP